MFRMIATAMICRCSHRQAFPVLLSLSLASLLLASCGEEGQPTAGYSDPCTTPMGSVLGCPASAQVSQTTSLTAACEKLVACGILAQEYLRRSGTECTDARDCSRDGDCLQTENGPRCHYHQLDYFWCYKALAEGRTDPCDNNSRFSADQVLQAASCIAQTPCNALGLSLAEKLTSREERSALDKYTCKAGTEIIWTATVCDFGLLSY